MDSWTNDRVCRKDRAQDDGARAMPKSGSKPGVRTRRGSFAPLAGRKHTSARPWRNVLFLWLSVGAGRGHLLGTQGHVKEASALLSGHPANARPGITAPPFCAARTSAGGPWLPLTRSLPDFGTKASRGPFDHKSPCQRGFLFLGTCVASLHVLLSSQARAPPALPLPLSLPLSGRLSKGTITPTLFLKSRI